MLPDKVIALLGAVLRVSAVPDDVISPWIAKPADVQLSAATVTEPSPGALLARCKTPVAQTS